MSFVSKELRQSAGHPDAMCMLNIAGVCTMQGCVLCHIRMAGEVGMGQKPDGTMAAFGCTACHAHFDSNGPRYKALGNSWAVPCAAWIGARIDAQLRAAQSLEAAA